MTDLFLIGLVIFNATLAIAWVRWLFESSRPKYRVVIHLRQKPVALILSNGEYEVESYVTPKPIVWLTNQPWPVVQRHLPLCGSDMGDCIVKSYEITPP
jgi:hypothetical protein